MAKAVKQPSTSHLLLGMSYNMKGFRGAVQRQWSGIWSPQWVLFSGTCVAAHVLKLEKQKVKFLKMCSESTR